MKETLAEASTKRALRWHKENTVGFMQSKGDFIAGTNWQSERMYSEQDMIDFGKRCFYKGFEKCESDDANCFTAWREEVPKLLEQIKK